VIEVRILPNILADGIDIWITMRGDDRNDRLVLSPQVNGPMGWQLLDPAGGIQPDPTITVPDEAGRAVLDALLRHYEGASDMHTVRGDLLHERDRVDRLLNTVCMIAGRPALP
jgi:hypothetical protein